MKTKRILELEVSGEHTRRQELEGERLVIGTGSDTSIRVVGASGVLPRHVEVSLDPTGARLAVVEEAPNGVVFRGSEHRKVHVPWGEEAYVGNLRLMFLDESEQSGRSKGPLLILAPLLVLAVFGVLTGAFKPASPSAQTIDAPTLAETPVACSASDSATTGHRALEAEHAARAKAERFLFDFSDGVDALRLYREAVACFDRAGRTADVARARTELADWQGRVNDEYAAMRLRLRVALDHDRYADALRAVKELQALLSDRPESAYLEWLARVRRELETKAAKSKA